MCVFLKQCAPPGCLIELCIQLSMIMLGKQLIQNNVFEVLIPYVHASSRQCLTASVSLTCRSQAYSRSPRRKLKKMYRTMQEEKGNKRASENNEEKEEEKRPKQQFDKDYTLEPYEGVGPEFMEMSRSICLTLCTFFLSVFEFFHKINLIFPKDGEGEICRCFPRRVCDS